MKNAPTMGNTYGNNRQAVPARNSTGMASQRRNPRRKRRRLNLKALFTLIFAATFLLFGGLWLHDLVRSAHEREANQKLIERVELQKEPAVSDSTVEESGMSDAEVSSAETEPTRNYLPLLVENEDLVAWLTIDGIDVDYPVMYTPESPEYYLRKGFDGSYALSGSLFIGADSLPGGTNIIIYGHKMNDGSMFGKLDAYADEDFAREHPEITYDLIQPDGSYQRLTFEVMAAFYGRVYTVEEENVFRYYYGTDLSDPEDFQYYVDQVMAASLYDLGVTANYGDRLLTLSTCSYHTDEGRFVVVAREK